MHDNNRQPTNKLPLSPGNTDLTRTALRWPAFTDLVRDSDGSYKQISKITEINNCLSAAVKRADSNIVLISPSPGVEKQEQWPVDALKFELYARIRGHVIKVVGERARRTRETDRFYSLLSMEISGASKLTFRLLS